VPRFLTETETGRRNPRDRVGGIKLGELQKLWWNWNICEGAFGSDTCASQAQVPEGFLFLAGARKDCESECTEPFLERRCDVPAGTYNIFIPLQNFMLYDFDDDDQGICPGDKFEIAEFLNGLSEPLSNYSELFARLNGGLTEIFYLYDDHRRFFDVCLSGFEICDDCDDPVCTDAGGVDAYPAFGWWALIEDVEINSGEVTTVEESTTNSFGFCTGVKYDLMGVSDTDPEPTDPPVSEPTDPPVDGCAVADFTIYDAETDTPVADFADGTTVCLPASGRVNIEAVLSAGCGRVDRVFLELRGGGKDDDRTERASPYMLYGDERGDIYGRDGFEENVEYVISAIADEDESGELEMTFMFEGVCA